MIGLLKKIYLQFFGFPDGIHMKECVLFLIIMIYCWHMFKNMKMFD